MTCELRDTTGARRPAPAPRSGPDGAGRSPGGTTDEERVVDQIEALSRNLHARLIPRLSALGFGLASVASRLDGQHRRRAMALVHELDDVVGVARECALGVLPAHPGVGGLRAYLGEMTARTGELGDVRALYSATGPVDSVPETVAAHLRAVVLEALTNAVRHAGADTVSVTVRVGDELRLTVADDGVGIPETPPDGIGLVVMAARARVLGGRFHVGPGRAGGTVVRWHVPPAGPGGGTTGGRTARDPIA